MSEFAPYHVVRTDLPVIVTVGKFYNLELALPQLRSSNRHFPKRSHALVYDGGVLNELEAEALLIKRKMAKFHVLRRDETRAA